MWVFPREGGTAPRYEQKNFSEDERRSRLRLVVSPDGADGSLTIGQDARLFAGIVEGREAVRHAIPDGRAAWLHVARGELDLNGEKLRPGDGAAIRDERDLELASGQGAEVVLWELPDVA
jgi:redox-sensitive bicupin YhaK (pirin superfamily)